MGARIASIRLSSSIREDHYRTTAHAEALYTLAPVKYAKTDLVIGSATKQDLTDLYEQHMVGLGKPGRDAYNHIIETPYRKCPYCDLGDATTLDHYLPKSRFPQFAILPANLVPSCRDCQGKKGRHVATNKTSQTLHPYFDHRKYVNDKWVVADIDFAGPTVARFRAEPPTAWTNDERRRASEHFKAHDLSKRYAIRAASELTMLNRSLQRTRATSGGQEVAKLLADFADGHRELCVNSWQTALYEALSNSMRYCNG